ncbi:MAG: AsmA family protein [Steroidobacteraceae bacterium]
MRLRKKPVVLTLAAIAAFVLLAAAALWLGARTDTARQSAADYLGELTGLPVSLASLAIGFLPTPTLELEGISIGQPPGFDDEPLVDIGSARIAVSWASLFGGDPAFRQIAISGATLRPAYITDGSDNWSALIDRLASLGGEGESKWSIGMLEIEDGAIEFYNAASNTNFRLTAIKLEAGSIAPAREFPFELQLAGVSGAHTLHFALEGDCMIDPEAGRYLARALTLRGWAGGDSLPLAGIEFDGGIGLASFDGKSGVAEVKPGTMTFAGIHSQFELRTESGERGTGLFFKLATQPFSPRAVAIAFGRPLPATADPAVFGSMQLSAAGRLEQGLLELDPVTGRLDDTQWSGALTPQIRKLRISADRIDIDRYLAPGSKTKSAKKATLEESLAKLRNLDIDAEIRIADARIAGAKLRDALLKVERGSE